MPDYSMVPVEHQPEFEDVSLVSVNHDPFSNDGTVQQAPTHVAQIPIESPQNQPQVQQTQFQQLRIPTQSAQPAPQTQPQQPATGASQPSAPTPGVGTTESAGSYQNALTAGTNDFFRSIPRGIVSGFNSAASALGRATQAEMGQDVDAPTPEQGIEILEREVTGPMHRPEGRAGKFGASVGEFLGNPPSYLVPGSLPLKVGTAVLGGLGSEAGGQLGEGTPLEAPFRFAGGLLGGLNATRVGAGARAAQTLMPAEEAGAGLRALTKALPRSPASRAAEKEYAGVGTTPNGGATFAGTAHLYPAGEGQRSIVRIPLSGSRRKDVELANEEGGFTEPPKGYVWHHVDDFDPQAGTSSLELVKKGAH